MEKEIMTYDKLQSLHTDNVVCDVQNIIRIGRNTALTSTNNIMTLIYRNVDRRIVEEQKGEGRATYGEELIKRISCVITQKK